MWSTIRRDEGSSLDRYGDSISKAWQTAGHNMTKMMITQVDQQNQPTFTGCFTTFKICINIYYTIYVHEVL